MTNIQIQKSQSETFCFQQTFLEVIEECSSIYNLEEDSKTLFYSSFLFNFFKLRKNNDLLNTNTIIMNWNFLQSFIHKNVQIINNTDLLQKKISNTRVQNIFRKQLNLKNTKSEKEKEVYFTNMLCSINNNLYENKITLLLKYIIKLFSKEADNIPFELYKILYIDILLTVERNPKILKDNNFDLVILVIFKRLQTINRYIPETNTEEFYSSLILEPPLKENFLFSSLLNCFDPTSSLELLIDLFSHKTWYEYFPLYEKEKENRYFSFFEEPYFKLEYNKRIEKYEEHTLEFLPSDFILLKNQNTLFKLWAERLFEVEKDFFYKIIKPSIIKRKNSIKINISDYDNNIEKIICGIRDTSSFNCKTENMIVNFSMITAIIKSEKTIEINISDSIYEKRNIND